MDEPEEAPGSTSPRVVGRGPGFAPGPSSKVSAMVLPLPGAALFEPYGAVGQLVEIRGAVTRGGVATCPFGSSAGGPASPFGQLIPGSRGPSER